MRVPIVLNKGAVPGLVEGTDLNLHVRVFTQNFLCIFIGVEGVHENERHVGAVRLVHVLQTTTTSS